MSSNNNGKKMIDLRITKLNTDPVQYKPYSPEFEPGCELVLRVEVPADQVIETDGELEDGLVTGVMVLSPEGFQFLAKYLSNMIEDMDKQRKQEQNDVHGVRRVRRMDD